MFIVIRYKKNIIKNFYNKWILKKCITNKEVREMYSKNVITNKGVRGYILRLDLAIAKENDLRLTHRPNDLWVYPK